MTKDSLYKKATFDLYLWRVNGIMCYQDVHKSNHCYRITLCYKSLKKLQLIRHTFKKGGCIRGGFFPSFSTTGPDTSAGVRAPHLDMLMLLGDEVLSFNLSAIRPCFPWVISQIPADTMAISVRVEILSIDNANWQILGVLTNCGVLGDVTNVRRSGFES